jgi:hypothetical protein
MTQQSDLAEEAQLEILGYFQQLDEHFHLAQESMGPRLRGVLLRAHVGNFSELMDLGRRNVSREQGMGDIGMRKLDSFVKSLGQKLYAFWMSGDSRWCEKIEADLAAYFGAPKAE